MLGQLAQRTVEYHHETVGPRTQNPAYLADSEGYVAPEMAFPEVRADVLLGLFGEAVAAEAQGDDDDFDDFDDFDGDGDDDDDDDDDDEPVEYESVFDDAMSEPRYWEDAW
jgi:hypothetical protein